ncbi:hypothetical protein MTR_4g074500 [Medicago truncatula]|uniref:Uncharacterized protein n=1 Tax=Medicago truncatula TaxID=3880 RepID=G7JNG5_MEDTR|nr:hypothetical protein MTR_4g074500 [Medicago truncatula]
MASIPFNPFQSFVGPLVKNPLSDLDKTINKLRLKYRSYIVEYDIDVGVVCLPNMFGGDFGDQIGRYAILTDNSTLHGNVPQMLDTLLTTVNIIDDCGNRWLNLSLFLVKLGRPILYAGLYMQLLYWMGVGKAARRLREGVKIWRGCSDGWVT